MTQSGLTFSNAQLVTLVVAELGGATKAVDIEDVAIRAFEIQPHRFSWRKYPERIDLRVVQYALKDAAKGKNGKPLLKGSLKHGYLLAPFGLSWVQENSNIAFDKIGTVTRKESAFDKLSIEQARLLTSSAFHKFMSEDLNSIGQSDFEEFARVNDYFPEHIRQKRFAVIKNAVQGHSMLEELWVFLHFMFVDKENENAST